MSDLAAAIIGTPSDVKGLLSEAGDATVLLLSRRQSARVDRAGGSLSELIAEFGDHSDECRGQGSREVLEKSSEHDLGHAPGWLDAGAVYEEIVAQLRSPQPPEFIFCMDPWAAQLISRDDANSRSRWYAVSDLETRTGAAHTEYWDQLGEWFTRMPFTGVIAKKAWEEAIRGGVERSPADVGSSIHLEKPGAWQWKRFGSAEDPGRTSENVLLFLVKYSGSLPHLRVFLESLARQDVPAESLKAVILTSGPADDLRTYLRWFGLAQPKLAIDTLSILEAGEQQWTAELDRALRESPKALVVLTGDHTILPERFAPNAIQMSESPVRPRICGAPMSAEASAHVLTGNLDAVANYEHLLAAFPGEPDRPSPECLRLVPGRLCLADDRGPVASIMEYTRESDAQASDRPEGPRVLLLGDLP